MSVAVAGFTLHYCLRISKLIVEAYECLAVGVETLNRGVDMIERIVVTTLAVFGLVINRRTLDLHLASREVTLEILHIGSRIPETPLLEREELQLFGLLRLVGEGEFLHLAPFLQRYEEEYRSLDTVLPTCDASVAHSMTALVEVEWGLTGFPSRIPYSITVFDIKVSAAIVHRYIVVTIAGDATELGIFVEAVTAGGV